MVAFERVFSGLPGLDKMLDSIRIGDNVVWQVSDIEDFRFVAEPFIRQSVKDGRNLVYIRFSQHAELALPQPGLKIYRLDPSSGFEAFTVRVHEIISSEGRGAFYVFDCLSALQEAWSTDLMMGNFFRVTCPYLFRLDTVAYFPLIRSTHSFDTVAHIRETTQLLLEMHHSGNDYYLHPVKVWNRYSGDMFLPHKFDVGTGDCGALNDGVSVSRFYAALEESAVAADRSLDNWDKYFALLKLQHANGMLPEDYGNTVCGIMMTKDDKIKEMIVAHFNPKDYFFVRDRMIGTGMIGGKACGMLLARKLISEHLPEFAFRMEPHDSFFIGSDVFYTYIVYNGCWDLRIRQRAERDTFDLSKEFGVRLKEGTFPQDIREQFRRMLDHFGQNPVIVRSSSFLEDGFGNAFAGKYESVFCANGGDPEQRLQAFEEAVKTVYASTMDPSALEYRKNRGLLERDEQMAVLVQRVSGTRHADLFMPAAAGVGYSHNAYHRITDSDPSAGMLRLVMGLGTRAVGRTEGDYPRIISLDKPLAVNFKSIGERHRFSQHKADVLDLSDNTLSEKSLEQIIDKIPGWHKKMTLSHDTEAEQFLREAGRPQNVFFADCQGLIENREFIAVMRKILELLRERYAASVDIEFTVNGSENGDFTVNLLQCRTLKINGSESLEIAEYPDENILFDICGSSMGRSARQNIDVVVAVDPRKYYTSDYRAKADVARVIGRINRFFRDKKKKLMLIVPGRIGTSSPELGVPVVYAEISSFCAVCEVSYSAAGYMPELSFGSHMFQDFVESDIFYGAVFEDARTRIYHPDLLQRFKNRMPEICDAGKDMNEMIGVYDLSAGPLTLSNDVLKARAVCAFADKTQLR